MNSRPLSINSNRIEAGSRLCDDRPRRSGSKSLEVPIKQAQSVPTPVLGILSLFLSLCLFYQPGRLTPAESAMV